MEEPNCPGCPEMVYTFVQAGGDTDDEQAAEATALEASEVSTWRMPNPYPKL